LVEVVLGRVEIGSTIDRFLPVSQAEERGENTRDQGGKRNRLVEIGIVIEKLVLDRAKQRNSGAQRIHRRGIGRESA
jgi:hypothetical protein